MDVYMPHIPTLTHTHTGTGTHTHTHTHRHRHRHTHMHTHTHTHLGEVILGVVEQRVCQFQVKLTSQLTNTMETHPLPW